MRLSLSVAFCVSALAVLPFAAAAAGQQPRERSVDDSSYSDNEYILTLRDGADMGEFKSWFARTSASQARHSSAGCVTPVIRKTWNILSRPCSASAIAACKGPRLQIMHLAVDDSDVQFLDAVAARPEVKTLRKSQIFKQEATTSGGYPTSDVVKQKTDLHHLKRISHRALDDANRGSFVYPKSAGEGVTVYVIDGTVRIDHEQFENRASLVQTIDPEWDAGEAFYSSHGTSVAALIAGKTIGVARKAKIVSVGACFAKSLRCPEWAILDALQTVQEHVFWEMTKPIINMSLGAPAQSDAIKDALDYMKQFGIPVIAAAGNENKDACGFVPAKLDSAITVAAATNQDKRSRFSNWGDCVDIFAPGEYMLTAGIASTEQYVMESGTSLAAPLAAGVAALWLSDGDYTPDEIRERMLNSATHGVITDNRGAANRLLYSDIPVAPKRRMRVWDSVRRRVHYIDLDDENTASGAMETHEITPLQNSIISIEELVEEERPRHRRGGTILDLSDIQKKNI